MCNCFFFRCSRETKACVHIKQRCSGQTYDIISTRSSQSQYLSLSYSGCRCGLWKPYICLFRNWLWGMYININIYKSHWEFPQLCLKYDKLLLSQNIYVKFPWHTVFTGGQVDFVFIFNLFPRKVNTKILCKTILIYFLYMIFEQGDLVLSRNGFR